MPPARIAAATPDDADTIAALHRRLFDPPWDAAAVAAMLDPPTGCGVVARTASPRLREDDGAIASADETRGGTPSISGFLLARVAGDEAEILSIGVAPEAQRQGLARRMMEAALPNLHARGARRLFLEVAADNGPALALYRQLGFAEVGRRRGYYARRNASPADALTMARDL